MILKVNIESRAKRMIEIANTFGIPTKQTQNKRWIVLEFNSSRKQEILLREIFKKEFKDKKENRGGARKGAGRPLKYSEKTKTVCFAIPANQIENIKKHIESQKHKWK